MIVLGASGLCMYVFAGMKVLVSFGVVCLRSDSSQSCLRGALCDLVPHSQGVACKSPPTSMIAERCADLISCCIYVRISLYIISCALVYSCGI